MRVFKWLYLLPRRISRSFETISGATGFEAGAGKLTTYMTGLKALDQKLERSTRFHDPEDKDDPLTPD